MSKLPKEIHYLENTWHCLSREYVTEEAAKVAFTKLHQEGKAKRGDMHLGVYRHQWEGSPSLFVSVVSINRPGVLAAGRLIGGQPVDWPLEVWHRLIARRARIIMGLHQQEAPAGSYRFPHTRRGGRLLPGGIMDEQWGQDD